MMGQLNFYIVDVFAEQKYSGNQLAVFRNCDGLSGTEMQKIAREINFSETTFITSEKLNNNGFDVRIFTPNEEVPFAGHPTIGTAHIIKNEILKNKNSKITLNTKVGQIPVTFDNSSAQSSIYWMQQIEPVFKEKIDSSYLAPILGLDLNDIDHRFPIQEVSTGLPHILVPVVSLEALNRAIIARDKYIDFVKNRWAKPIMIFCPETHEPQNNISVRMFADCYGIIEDPATGSGNGALAGYLVKHKYFGKDSINIRSEQGYKMGRPSLLYLKASENNTKISIFIGGNAITIAKGAFR